MDFKINFANNRNTIIEIDPTNIKSWNAEFNYTNGTYLHVFKSVIRSDQSTVSGTKEPINTTSFENAIEKEGSILERTCSLAPFALDAEEM